MMDRYWTLVIFFTGCAVHSQPQVTTIPTTATISTTTISTSTNVTTIPPTTVATTTKSPGLHVRLVNGKTTSNFKSGRVEVSTDGVTWGSVCDDFFNKSAAVVVCKSQGFVDGEAIAKAAFASSQGPILLDDVECQGTEPSLDFCRKNPIKEHDCKHSEDVGVYCFNDTGAVFQMQLQEDHVDKALQTHWGRLAVKLGDMEWGSVCDDLFNLNAAAITCRYFQYRYGQQITGNEFKNGARTYLDEVLCRGTESSLLQCRHNSWRTHDCGRDEDVGVVCFNTAVRLRSMSLAIRRVGVVEVWRPGSGWYDVCDKDWDDMDAGVACRELGYKDGRALMASAFAGGIFDSSWGDEHPWSNSHTMRGSYTSINCTGNETRLIDCEKTRRGHLCNTENMASVICYNTPLDQVDNATAVRLVNGSTNWGRVEIRHLGFWGQVCSDSWSDKEADVVCRMQGFTSGYAFGEITREVLPAWITEVSCIGNETNIEDCTLGMWGEPTSYCTPAHVLCYNTSVYINISNPDRGYGRVDITYDNVTGTICNDQWGDTEAAMVCKMLGYPDGKTTSEDLGKGSGPVYMSSVSCGLGDQSIYQCDTKGWGLTSTQCENHENDAGVRCYKDVRLHPGSYNVGVVQAYSYGRWQAICGRSRFDDNAARVVCSALNFLNGSALPLGVFARQDIPTFRSNISCIGNESSILDCEFDSSSGCLPFGTSYASVSCYDTIKVEEPIYKLEGRINSGRVRVFKHQVWGYICDRYWGDNDANVLCRELGFLGGISYKYAGNFNGPFFITEINCAGNESSLEECPTGPAICSSLQAAGVLCYNTEAPKLQFSPRGGSWGRLDLAIDQEAGRVCSHLWDDNDATVACAQLGFNDGLALKFPKGPGSVYMTELQCFGNEKSIFQCKNPGWANVLDSEACTSTDAGAFCFKDVRLTESVVNQNVALGKISMLIGGVWRRLCADSFDQVDAVVACKSVSFPNAMMLRTKRAVYSPSYVTKINCYGNESSLVNCQRDRGQCPYNVGEARIVCFDEAAQTETKYYIQHGFHGRVMVEKHGLNGSICEDGWDDDDANVLCKEFGYPGGIAFGNPKNESFELFWLSNVNCTGSETSIADCAMNATVSSTCRDSTTSAGVLCYRTGVDIRLANGGKNYGRVEVSYDGVWGTICDFRWSRYDARAVCRQLGFVEGDAYAQSRYGRGSGPVYLDDMQCRISEPSLLYCPNRGWNSTATYCQSHENDAGVYCYPKVRLEPTEEFGAVEIWTKYKYYGLVCAEDFTDREARVVCREQGHLDGRSLCCSAFGDLHKPVVMSDVHCSGDESSVYDCQHNIEAPVCNSQMYASVVCTNVTDNTDAYIVKLDNGTRGRVVLRHLGHDGVVCPDGFDNNDANVVCKEIGMTNGGLAYKRINLNRRRSIKELRWMTGINCNGDEALLTSCPGASWYDITSCAQLYDAAAFCYREQDVALPAFRLEGGSRLHGRIEIRINGTWGSICGINVDDAAANILCKHLNFPSGSAGKAGSAGQSSGPVWINQLACQGNESSILDCPLMGMGEEDDLCKSHLVDAVIQCHTTVRLSGDINGRTDYGRLELSINGSWLPVCDSGFADTAVEVACRQMGHTHGVRQCCSALGSLPGPKTPPISRITCEGNEEMLINCSLEQQSCSSNNYVSVACSETALEDDISISLSPNKFVGMVNVSRYGVSGAICAEQWNDTEASAACRQLGYLGGVAIYGAKLDVGMPLLMGNVKCAENGNLTDCSHDELDEDHGCADSRRGASVLCVQSLEGIQYRLAPGSSENKGMAQMLFNDVWRYISRLGFGDKEAAVFCRSIGYVSGQVYWGSITSGTSGSVVASEVSCKGTESHIHQCQAEWDPDRNRYIPSSFGVSVSCFKGVRIERGDTKTNGIVKVYVNGVWGTVCADSEFGDDDASVICQELGFTAGLALCCGPYGFNFDDAVMSNVRCTGNEKSILNCKYHTAGRTSLCYRQNYASVACYNGTLTNNYTVSLTGGSPYTGEVTVTYNGVDGRVCSDDWDDMDASVVCRQLGFTEGMAYTHYRSSFSFFDFTGPYWTSNVNCTGSEAELGDCPHLGFGRVKSCVDGHFAGALCYTDSGLFYRMASGGDQWGRVEVSVDGHWGTVCDRYWDQREAHVFCKALGFDDGDPFYGDFNDTATGTVWESNLRCTGYENNLNECPHEGWQHATSRTCAEHKRDAGVFCYTKVKLSTGVGRAVQHGGVLWNMNGYWYHVCDTGFNDNSARIVCEALGFKDGRSICCSAYGKEDYDAEGLLTNMTLRCTGEETSIDQCVVEEECKSNLYASVVCTETPSNFDNRNYTIKMKSSADHSGQLRVTHFGVEGRICATDWDDADATVFCRGQGYLNGMAYQHSFTGTYSTARQLGPFWFSSFNCSGQETSLLDCAHLDRTNLGNCTLKHTASVLCFNQTGLDYRLVSGNNHFGRAEIRVGGVWGTICDNYWDAKDANVLCRQLNFSDGVALTGAHYGEGSGPIWVSHLQCTGEEDSLSQCPHRGYQDLFSSPSFGWPFTLPCTSHKDDASVFCYRTVSLNQKFGSTKGGLEVYDNGKKLGVCDTGFNNTAAKVACMSLGMNFTYGRAVQGSVFGNISGPIAYTSITCHGGEADLRECTMSKVGECQTKTYASVYCAKVPFNDTGFEIRIASDGLSKDYHGILEVKDNGVWGRICMQGWEDVDANTACKTLKYKGGVAYLHIVKNSNAILMRNFRCTGNETSLEHCPYDKSADKEECSFNANDAGVICYNGTGVQYRLSGGHTGATGRVEIGYDGYWGTVCSWAWSTSNAKVFCQTLGYKDGLPQRDTIPGLPQLDRVLSGAFCNGDEQSILTCLNSGFNTSLLSYLCRGEAYTSCYGTEISMTNIRLVGGEDKSKGRVEVYITGPNSWGTVCDDYWDHTDATVVCKSLGYDGGRAVNASAYGKGTGPIWMDNVECVGNETSLGDCKNRGFGTHNCNHSEDASVECYYITTPVIATTPTTKTTTTTLPTSTFAATTTTTPPTPTPTTTPTTSKTTTSTSATTTTTTPTTTSATTTTPSTTTTPATSPTTSRSTTTPTTTSITTSTMIPAGVTEGQKTPESTIIMAVVIPIVVLIAIISIISVVLWKTRRHQKSHISHERFHDDVIEQTHDGSIAMRNQLYDMSMANGEAGDPMSDSIKQMAEDAEISFEGNGYAHFSKAPDALEDDSGGFSNPLYAVMKDPSESSDYPAQLKLDVDLHATNT